MPFLVAYEGGLLLDDDVEKARMKALELIGLYKSPTPMVVYELKAVRRLIPPPVETPAPKRHA